MKVAIPHWRGRISPVFDVAGNLLVVEIDDGREVSREQVPLYERGGFGRIRELAAIQPGVLICGAISWRMEAALADMGTRVIPHVCGPVEDVLAAFRCGELDDSAFLMPGCRGRGRQFRGSSRRGRGWGGRQGMNRKGGF